MDKKKRIIKLIDKFIKLKHPGFNKKDAHKFYPKSGGLAFVNPKKFKFDLKTGNFLLDENIYVYYAGNIDWIYIHPDLYKSLSGIFGSEMKYFVDWFNLEFDWDATRVKPY
jgi:hypothetical protein